MTHSDQMNCKQCKCLCKGVIYGKKNNNPHENRSTCTLGVMTLISIIEGIYEKSST